MFLVAANHRRAARAVFNREIDAGGGHAEQVRDVILIAGSPVAVRSRLAGRPDAHQRRGDLAFGVVSADAEVVPPLRPFLPPGESRRQIRHKIAALAEAVHRRDRNRRVIKIGNIRRIEKCGTGDLDAGFRNLQRAFGKFLIFADFQVFIHIG